MLNTAKIRPKPWPRDWMHEARQIAHDEDSDLIPRREHVREAVDTLDYHRSQWIPLLHSLGQEIHRLQEKVRKLELELSR